jgi:hypothetical protein
VGNWVSPARGLFIFSPFLLALPVGLIRQARAKRINRLDAAVLTIVGLHWLSISLFPHWYAGFSFGPRFMSDMLPYLIYLLARTVALPWPPVRSLRGGALRVALGALALVSLLIHHAGATNPATWFWNSQPLSVDEVPARLWQWSDLQFLRGLASREVAVSRSGMEPVGNSAEIDVTLSNMSAFPQLWEFVLPTGVAVSDPAAFSAIVDQRGVVALRLIRPIPPHENATITLNVDDATSDRSLRIDVWQDQSERSPQAMIVLPIARLLADGPPQQLLEPLEPPPFQLVYGAGWYSLETLGDAQWRWADSPAVLYFYAPTARPVDLTLTFGDLYAPDAPDGKGTTGRVTVSSSAGFSTEQVVNSAQPVRVTIDAQAGWNAVTLSLETGSFTPNALDPNNSDRRSLSFIVTSATLQPASD